MEGPVPVRVPRPPETRHVMLYPPVHRLRVNRVGTACMGVCVRACMLSGAFRVARNRSLHVRRGEHRLENRRVRTFTRFVSR